MFINGYILILENFNILLILNYTVIMSSGSKVIKNSRRPPCSSEVWPVQLSVEATRINNRHIALLL